MSAEQQEPGLREQSWVVIFTTGARGKTRTAEVIVTSNSANKARRLGVEALTPSGNEWVRSAAAKARVASPQDLMRLQSRRQAAFI